MTKSIREVATEIVDRTIENAECASQYNLNLVDTEFKRSLELNMRNEIEMLLGLITDIDVINRLRN